MARSDTMQGGRMEAVSGDSNEDTYLESPGPMQVMPAGNMNDGVSTTISGNPKLDGPSTIRPVGQVPPAPRNNSNLGVSLL